MLKIMIRVFFIFLFLQIAVQAKDININHLIQSAKNSDKHLLLWLHMTDCEFCSKMKKSTLSNANIKSFIDKNFVYKHINIFGNDKVIYDGFKGSGREFAQKIGYDFYPLALFFDGDSKMVFSEAGYIDNKDMPNEKRFIALLKYIDSKAYKKEDFDDYLFDFEDDF